MTAVKSIDKKLTRQFLEDIKRNPEKWIKAQEEKDFIFDKKTQELIAKNYNGEYPIKRLIREIDKDIIPCVMDGSPEQINYFNLTEKDIDDYFLKDGHYLHYLIFRTNNKVDLNLRKYILKNIFIRDVFHPLNFSVPLKTILEIINQNSCNIDTINETLTYSLDSVISDFDKMREEDFEKLRKFGITFEDHTYNISEREILETLQKNQYFRRNIDINKIEDIDIKVQILKLAPSLVVNLSNYDSRISDDILIECLNRVSDNGFLSTEEMNLKYFTKSFIKKIINYPILIIRLDERIRGNRDIFPIELILEFYKTNPNRFPYLNLNKEEIKAIVESGISFQGLYHLRKEIGNNDPLEISILFLPFIKKGAQTQALVDDYFKYLMSNKNLDTSIIYFDNCCFDVSKAYIRKEYANFIMSFGEDYFRYVPKKYLPEGYRKQDNNDSNEDNYEDHDCDYFMND